MRHSTRRAAVWRTPAGLLLGVSTVVIALAAAVLWRATDDDAAAVPPRADVVATAAPQIARTPDPGQVTATAPEDEPAAPVTLSVKALGLTMPVEPVGVSGDGQMVMPENPETIGWYRFGPSPGSTSGAAVLAGHVDSKKYGVGPLVKLRQSKAGDTIVVEDADGQRTTYRVESTELLPKQSIALDKVFTRSGDPMLHVLTCGGAYLPDQGGYQDNVLVTAAPQ